MSDTMKHVAVCFVLAITVMAVARIMRTWMPTAMTLAVIFTMAVGAMKEAFDAMTPGNRWDWDDIKADAVGCFLGTAAGVLLWLC